MSKDAIPNSDSDFNNWLKIIAAYINSNFLALGLTSDQNDALQDFLALWIHDYPAHLAGQANASSLKQTKDNTRRLIEEFIRPLIAMMQANPAVTNEMKAAMQITIPKTTHTPSPVPATRPMASIDNRNRLEQTVHFYDESTPNSKAKPEGVRGCELWLKIGGAPPTGESEVKYVATDTRTPYIYHFLPEDAGKTAHWMLRWVNTRNEPGPWSETVSVTISA
jgi:hypothetical protein